MPYQNEFDKTGNAGKDGERAEQNFIRLFYARYGVMPIKATEYENKVLHIDYHMRLLGKDGVHSASVDVKSWKHREDCVFVELVSYGKRGWLYGEATFIGFEDPSEEFFVMVKRTALLEYVKEHCVANFWTGKHTPFYELHLRSKTLNKGDKTIETFDCVTLLPIEDLENIEHWVLK